MYTCKTPEDTKGGKNNERLLESFQEKKIHIAYHLSTNSRLEILKILKKIFKVQN